MRHVDCSNTTKELTEQFVRPAPPASDTLSYNKSDIAVIVSCHNYGTYLRECLQSILNQTVTPQRILVVDDASDDDTAEVCALFTQVDYLRVEYRHVGRTRRAGLEATREPIVLFVDADNWLEADFIEEGLKCFADRNTAGVYSDFQCFGSQTVFQHFPEFDRGELFRRNYIDTCSLIRRDALELIDWVWDESPLVPEDHCRAQALVLEGWNFKKQRSYFHYRCHPRQASKTLSPARSKLNYFKLSGLSRWPITVFIPLAGRQWAWQQQSEYLNRQEFPHDKIRLILCDTSQDDAFSQEVREWLLQCDYSDVRHMKFSLTQKGIADRPRNNVSLERQINLAMCRIYNRMRAELQTELVWILEDDIIPPDDVLARLLGHLRENVASVSAAYNSRFDGFPLAWSGDAAANSGTPRCIPKYSGIESVRGTGFGCLLLRSHLVRQHVFSLPSGVRYYDPEFFKQLGDQWTRLCDWSCWCKHLDLAKPDGYV